MQYEIPNLVQGTCYYVRVQAWNIKGFGKPCVANPPSATPSSQWPSHIIVTYTVLVIKQQSFLISQMLIYCKIIECVIYLILTVFAHTLLFQVGERSMV